ncbi:glutamate receptor 1-like isoform X2 [Leptidea sinapis]|uniref:glutamate receptor 1-like isoform X2 n=1 Tax=Leptidea sinapis TaxID=189913 RepID=UPI0021C2D195|nr:glutamate receptor 1-like isoform X2 [Leptidea sinapis]
MSRLACVLPFAGLLLFLQRVSGQAFSVEKIAVGAIFDQNTEEIQNVFKYAMTVHNQNISTRRLELQAYVDVINTADAFKLSRLICNQFARGVFAMLGAVTPESFDTLHSYTNTFQMPFVTPWFPEKVIPPSSGLIDYALSMRPDYHQAIVDVILHYNWDEVIFIYDSHDGLLRLQQLFQTMQPGRAAFKISLVKRINNPEDAIEFLMSVEAHDRWSKKRIVLDCNTKNAKSILLEHVRKVELGRRTYHYLLSGLVMDDQWENEVTEYGALNITGFRIVDHTRKVVRDFTEGLRRMDPRFKGAVSAQTAFMYDGVHVLMDALGRLYRKKPESFRAALRRAAALSNTTKVIDCNPGKGWVIPFEYGDKISRLIKKTDIEGLTGNISFNEEGHRHNFTLHIVEMTVQSAMVPVAMWSDKYGLSTIKSPKFIRLHTPTSFDTNRTYIITGILQEPYLMIKPKEFGQREEQFHGFSKDLVDFIAKRLGIKYIFKTVRDGQFGSQTDEGWNGLVGEVIRREADLAVAPLAITPEREQVVDFTEPYLSVENPIIQTKTPKQLADTFSFLRPLSKEIWLCVLFSFFAVSIVLFLVSRFSPHEWKSITVSDTRIEQAANSNNEIILHNEFSIWNSFWFSLGSFMQQGSDVVPRSLSGRIVGTVWWFFALILVCSYTANLAAYLIVEKISEPTQFLTYSSKIKFESEFLPNNDLVKDPEVVNNPPFTMDSRYKNSCATPKICRYKHVDFGIALTKGSPIKEALNLVIVDLKKDEIIVKLWHKWMMEMNKPKCEKEKEEESTMSEMTLSQVAGIFYVLVGGLALALGVALLEFCHHGRNETPRTAKTLSALKAKAKLTAKSDKKSSQRSREQERLGWNGAAFTGTTQEEAVHASFTHV